MQTFYLPSSTLFPDLPSLHSQCSQDHQVSVLRWHWRLLGIRREKGKITRESAQVSPPLPRTQVSSFPGPNPYPNPTLAAPCQPSFSKLTAGSGSPGPSLTSSVLLWWQIPRLCSWQFGALAGSQGAPLLITFLTAIHSLWLETIRMPGPALAGSYITTNMWALHHYKQGPC